jgi:hypothetical protein
MLSHISYFNVCILILIFKYTLDVLWCLDAMWFWIGFGLDVHWIEYTVVFGYAVVFECAVAFGYAVVFGLNTLWCLDTLWHLDTLWCLDTLWHLDMLWCLD